jgi:hypothetical protein
MKNSGPALCGIVRDRTYKRISRRIRNRNQKYFRASIWGLRGNRLAKKTEGRKSRDSVPLSLLPPPPPFPTRTGNMDFLSHVYTKNFLFKKRFRVWIRSPSQKSFGSDRIWIRKTFKGLTSNIMFAVLR